MCRSRQVILVLLLFFSQPKVPSPDLCCEKPANQIPMVGARPLRVLGTPQGQWTLPAPGRARRDLWVMGGRVVVLLATPLGQGPLLAASELFPEKTLPEGISPEEFLWVVAQKESVWYEQLEDLISRLQEDLEKMDRQILKLATPGQKLSLVSIRVEQVQGTLQEVTRTILAAGAEAKKLHAEMTTRGLGRSAIRWHKERVCDPLEVLSHPGTGQLHTTVASFSHLRRLLDLEGKADVEAAREARESLSKLQRDLYQFLGSKGCGRSLLQDLIPIAEEQRRVTEILRKQLEDLQGIEWH
jgi:hypothetical protein